MWKSEWRRRGRGVRTSGGDWERVQTTWREEARVRASGGEWERVGKSVCEWDRVGTSGDQRGDREREERVGASGDEREVWETGRASLAQDSPSAREAGGSHLGVALGGRECERQGNTALTLKLLAASAASTRISKPPRQKRKGREERGGGGR
eukprot:3033368-Rhodomonas_salina.1